MAASVRSYMAEREVQLINKFYSRKAGLWCDVCQQEGSHLTDKHDFYYHGAAHREEYERSQRKRSAGSGRIVHS